MKAGLVDHNPTIGTVKGRKPRASGCSRSRSCAAIWQATAELNAHDAIVRLLLLTGQRKAEIGGLAWAELDRPNALVLLSGQRTKNGRPHELPLSRQALRDPARVPGAAALPLSSAGAGRLRSPAGARARRGSTPGSLSSRARRWRRGACTICAEPSRRWRPSTA